ncbi:LamG domain-containing protein [Candidatus Poribacteria bacterium]|nr:LamG domain-containing protein [Candidatus Poribacteria bacterium]
MKPLVARLALVCISFIVMNLMLVSISDAKIDKATIAAMWLFDEGSGKVAKDSSGKGNDGQFAGGGTLKWVDGRSGKGLEFDGKSWLECGKGESLDFKASENFSIHAVVNASASPTGKCIIWKGLGCSTWSQWLLGTGEHENAVNVTNATFHFRTANGGGRTEVRSKDPLPEGKWVQVCGTYDGKKLRIYVDGSLSNEADASGKPWASTEQVYIGADPGCGNRCQWVGVIDEIVVFNVTLAADDVKSLARGFAGASAVAPVDKLTTTWGSIKTR